MFASLMTLFLVVSSVGSTASLVPEERIDSPTGMKVRIENTSGKTINALHYSVDCPKRGKFGRYRFEYNFDTLVNYGADKPLVPERFLVFALPSNAGDCPGGVDAVLFSDGTTLGTPEKVQIIRDRRMGVARALSDAQPMLQNIVALRMSPAYVANELEMRANNRASDRTISQEMRQGELFINSVIISFLRKDEAWYLPATGDRKEQPWIENVMRERVFNRDQARASIATTNIDKWKAALAAASQ